jgi:hypothetical protein
MIASANELLYSPHTTLFSPPFAVAPRTAFPVEACIDYRRLRRSRDAVVHAAHPVGAAELTKSAP